jgi:hypothetical protein
MSDLRDRAITRKHLALLLENALVGDDKPAQAVYSYRIGDFKGQSPIVVVTSDGSERGKKAQPTRAKTIFKYLVIIFVVYSMDKFNWTEQDAEDRLDLLERAISNVLLSNDTVVGEWALLSAGTSQTDDVEIGGALYRREIIPVEATLYEN